MPGKQDKKAYLLDKKLPKEAVLKVLDRAKEDRGQGYQVLTVHMKKNKKFQKEQLVEEGYQEIIDCYADVIEKW